MSPWILRCPIFFCALAILSIGSRAAGQLSMSDAVCRALNDHPQLKVAKSDIAIAQARLIDAGKMENPVFEFALNSHAKDGPEREGSIFIGYSQLFPITDKLCRQRELGLADIELACAEVREVERNLIAKVQEAYIEAAGARALITEMRRIESSAERSIALTRQQIEAAQSSELDLAAAETEKLLASQERAVAEGELRQALAKLRPLLHLAPDQGLIPSQSLDSILSHLRAVVDSDPSDGICRSDITVAKLREQRSIVDEKLARSEAYEDWEFEAGYEEERAYDDPVGVERDRFLGAGIKIPLRVKKHGFGRIAESEANTEKARHELERVKLAAMGEVALARSEYRAADNTSANIREHLLPQLEARESKTEKAYEEGLVDFNQVLLIQQQQYRIRRALAQAKLDKALALARLQYALGSHPRLLHQPHGKPKKHSPEVIIAEPVVSSPVAPIHSEPSKSHRRFKGLFSRFRRK